MLRNMHNFYEYIVSCNVELSLHTNFSMNAETEFEYKHILSMKTKRSFVRKGKNMRCFKFIYLFNKDLQKYYAA